LVNIITGNVNQGKTRYMRSLYEKIGGDGFICVKVFDKNNFQGYDLVRLTTGESTPFARKIDAIPGDWDEIYRYGIFSFSGHGFTVADRIIAEIIKDGAEPIFIDEVGPLEIVEQKGFYKLLKRVLKLNREVYISIRNELVNELIEEFKIYEPQIVRQLSVSSRILKPDVFDTPITRSKIKNENKL
jgi:nucleoside-triphosphatase THEP1